MHLATSLLCERNQEWGGGGGGGGGEESRDMDVDEVHKAS